MLRRAWTCPPPRISRHSCWCFPPLDEEDKYCILPYFWVPEETLELRVRRDHVPLPMCGAAGEADDHGGERGALRLY